MSKNDFEYKYSAPTTNERREIESIRNSYLEHDKGTEKLQQLRKLDSKVKNTPTTISLVFGIVGLLVFGLGMTCVLEWGLIVAGVIIGALGVIPMVLAYPMYNKIYNKLKNKYGKTIIDLSNELLGEEQDEKKE